ncbi:MAG: hypothetical protein LBI43_05930 [Streptococcaceae bacterium]|jgi:putative GTP pyrophosphokinase|nr:hypothetical protein [Streptococcaceae bacterium]
MVLNKEILATRFAPDEFDALKRELVKYEAALHLVLTNLSNLTDYYKAYTPANPIEHIKSRLKQPESIAGKLKKKALPITAEAAVANLKDIAGIRIICGYAKDIFDIAEVLRQQDAFRVLSEKDYLTEAKPSGYRSYHMILEVKLGGLFGNETVPVEVQLRTSAQDFWATLEHKVRYKYGGDMPLHLSNELQTCAEQIHALDERMYLIHELVDLINEDEASDAYESSTESEKLAAATEKILAEDNQELLSASTTTILAATPAQVIDDEATPAQPSEQTIMPAQVLEAEATPESPEKLPDTAPAHDDFPELSNIKPDEHTTPQETVQDEPLYPVYPVETMDYALDLDLPDDMLVPIQQAQAEAPQAPAAQEPLSHPAIFTTGPEISVLNATPATPRPIVAESVDLEEQSPDVSAPIASDSPTSEAALNEPLEEAPQTAPVPEPSLETPEAETLSPLVSSLPEEATATGTPQTPPVLFQTETTAAAPTPMGLPAGTVTRHMAMTGHVPTSSAVATPTPTANSSEEKPVIHRSKIL